MLIIASSKKEQNHHDKTGMQQTNSVSKSHLIHKLKELLKNIINLQYTKKLNEYKGQWVQLEIIRLKGEEEKSYADLIKFYNEEEVFKNLQSLMDKESTYRVNLKELRNQAFGAWKETLSLTNQQLKLTADGNFLNDQFKKTRCEIRKLNKFYQDEKSLILDQLRNIFSEDKVLKEIDNTFQLIKDKKIKVESEEDNLSELVDTRNKLSCLQQKLQDIQRYHEQITILNTEKDLLDNEINKCNKELENCKEQILKSKLDTELLEFEKIITARSIFEKFLCIFETNLFKLDVKTRYEKFDKNIDIFSYCFRNFLQDLEFNDLQKGNFYNIFNWFKKKLSSDLFSHNSNEESKKFVNTIKNSGNEIQSVNEIQELFSYLYHLTILTKEKTEKLPNNFYKVLEKMIVKQDEFYQTISLYDLVEESDKMKLKKLSYELFKKQFINFLKSVKFNDFNKLDVKDFSNAVKVPKNGFFSDKDRSPFFEVVVLYLKNLKGIDSIKEEKTESVFEFFQTKITERKDIEKTLLSKLRKTVKESANCQTDLELELKEIIEKYETILKNNFHSEFITIIEKHQTFETDLYLELYNIQDKTIGIDFYSGLKNKIIKKQKTFETDLDLELKEIIEKYETILKNNLYLELKEIIEKYETFETDLDLELKKIIEKYETFETDLYLELKEMIDNDDLEDVFRKIDSFDFFTKTFLQEFLYVFNKIDFSHPEFQEMISNLYFKVSFSELDEEDKKEFANLYEKKLVFHLLLAEFKEKTHIEYEKVKMAESKAKEGLNNTNKLHTEKDQITQSLFKEQDEKPLKPLFKEQDEKPLFKEQHETGKHYTKNKPEAN